MKTAQRYRSKWVRIFAYTFPIPIILCVTLSCSPAILAIAGAWTLNIDHSKISETASQQELLTIRRKIQKHFLGMKTYIPMEDILIPQDSVKTDDRLKKLMRKACGKGTIYIWIPLKFRWPLSGDKVMDWCWKS